MLSFCAEFPVDAGLTSDRFLETIQDWVISSPHTFFQAEDFDLVAGNETFSLEKNGQKLRANRVSAGHEHAVSFQNTIADGNLEWHTCIVFSKHPADCWVSVRTQVESAHPTVRLPPAKKPIVVRKLLEKIGGAVDGALQVTAAPHFLTNNDIDIASRLILGADCWLPVVYVSCGFDGNHLVDPKALASDLAGMAHVVVEPNRPFSRRLQIEVKSVNSYGGSIGIYWPNATGRRSFFIGDAFEDKGELKRAIVEEVRAALLNRRPLYRCTLAAVEEASSRLKLERLKSSGSEGIDEYVASFDRELRAKDERLADSEREISRLQFEIKKYEADSRAGRGITISLGEEQDLYENEISGFVVDALADAVQRVQSDSRREHVLTALVDANSLSSENNYREELKEILRGYTSMDKSSKTALEKMGFSIKEDGKHYKLEFKGDDRYTYSLPKSGSDKRRGGLNAASDISKRLF